MQLRFYLCAPLIFEGITEPWLVNQSSRLVQLTQPKIQLQVYAYHDSRETVHVLGQRAAKLTNFSPGYWEILRRD